MLLQKKHPDIDPRVLILEPIEVCSLLNRKKLNAQEIMGRTHGIARGSDERVVSQPKIPPKFANEPAPCYTYVQRVCAICTAQTLA